MSISNTSEPQFTLISPEKLPEEIYPYRRVWRALALEIGAMLGMVVIVLVGVLVGILRDVPSQNWGLLLILVPLGVYLSVSVRGEQRALLPREGLLTVTLFSALLANGVGVPLVRDIFRPEEWLSSAGFFSRVLGYACTFGVTSEFLKYIAVRYTVWPRRIRVRMDGVAYSVAASVGYAAVLNLQVVFVEAPVVSADALRVATNFISQVGIGVIMGYFMAEMALHNRPPFFLPLGLLIASLVHGLYIGFRGITTGSDLALGAAGGGLPSFNALLVLLLFAVVIGLAINFLIDTADAREASRKGMKRVR